MAYYVFIDGIFISRKTKCFQPNVIPVQAKKSCIILKGEITWNC